MEGGGGWSDDEGGMCSYGGDVSPVLTAPRKLPNRSVADKVPDPWAPLDPHEVKKQDEKPFRKGNTFRPPKASQSKAKKRKSVDQPPPPKQPLLEFIVDSFYSHSSLFPKQQWKAPSYPESEAQHWKETNVRKRRQKMMTAKLKQARKEAVLVQAPAMEEVDDEDGGYSLNYVHDDVVDDDSLQNQVDTALGRVGGGEVVGDYSPPHGTRVDPVAFNVSCDVTTKRPGLVQSYEELVRDYVEQTLVQAHTYAQETELSKRVQEWDDRIRPQLQEEDRHPPFDIHTYGSQIVEDLDHTMRQTESEWISFVDLVNGKTRYDICRIFSAMLQLANNHNVKIDVAEHRDEGEDSFSLQLLSKKLVFEDILEFRAPSVFTSTNDNELDE
jgi:condensin-2 complex subunit H2